MLEANEAADLIEKAAARDANIIFGASIKEDLEDEIRITVIATGFDSEEEEEVESIRPAASSAESRPAESGQGRPEEQAEALHEAQQQEDEVSSDDDIEVPDFLQGAIKAMNNRF